MFTRILTKPNNSILLIGPRGIGKSTWVKQILPDSRYYDLLNTSEALRFSRDASQLYNELNYLPQATWIVIDEVQKVPALLNEVHRLIENCKLKFILCGSSARKLKHA